MKSYVNVRLKVTIRNSKYLCPMEITMLQRCPRDYLTMPPESSHVTIG